MHRSPPDKFLSNKLYQFLLAVDVFLVSLTISTSYTKTFALSTKEPNVSMRERYAVRFLELSLNRIQRQKGMLLLKDERTAILKYLPDFSYTRDEVLNQFVNRQIKTSRQYRAVAPLFVQNADNIRDAESSGHMFWKDQMRDIFMNFSASAKTGFLLWMMGVGKKPEEIIAEEYRLHISFDSFRDAMGLYSGKFYKDIGKRDQREFFISLFLGEKGIFSNQASYDDFISYIILSLFRVESKAMEQLFRAALNTKDLQRRQRILYSLLQKYHQLRNQGSREEILAKSVRVFLEANGLIGIKLGQFLAHSAVVKVGSPLQRELLELNNASDPIDKGILFDMLEKIYKGRAFDDVYDSLDDVKGVGGVAQVNEARRKNGTKAALKFKKPEIDKVIVRELAFLEDEVLKPCAAALEAEGMPVPAGLLSRLKEMFEEELNFGDMEEDGDGEANNQQQLKKNVEGRKTTVVNGVTYEFVVPTSDAVHANVLMEQQFAEGVALKNEDEMWAQGINTDVIKELLMKELLQQFLADGFYHADLHSGNVLVRKENGRVLISLIDVGAASRISIANREILVGVLMALGDRNNWTVNKELIYRLFPQIQDGADGEAELEGIVQSERNPIQKLMYLFVLLEKKNIEFKDDYKEFYSVIRFLKASEYLFSDVLLAKVMGSFSSMNVEEVKSRVLAITADIKNEFTNVQVPTITTSINGLSVVITTETIGQIYESLKRLKDLPFWTAASSAFPQIDQLVDLIFGAVGHLRDRNQDFEFNVPREQMPVYADIRSDIMVLIGLIQRGSLSPMALMSALAAVKRIAAKRDNIIDLILSQNLPVDELMSSVRRLDGDEVAGRLKTMLQPRIKEKAPNLTVEGVSISNLGDIRRGLTNGVARAVISFAQIPEMAKVDRGQKGGIDLTHPETFMQTKNDGGEMKFRIDPAMLQQLQNTTGFVPVIINIQPMKDLRLFLGLTEANPHTPVSG